MVAILIYFIDEESDAMVVSAIALINTESTSSPFVESTTEVSTEEELHAVNNVATATTKINFFIFYF
jgi:hypothetical protein